MNSHKSLHSCGQKYENKDMDYQLSSSLSNEENARCTASPIIPKDIYNAKHRTPKLQVSLRKNAIINQMQQRLILLLSACKKCKDFKTLQPKEEKYLALWKHIQDCQDKDCKRIFCKSTCRILHHYKYCKLSNQASTCKVCSPVMKYIAQESCDDNILTSKKNCKAHMEKLKQMASIMIYDSSKNKPSISYTPKRISETSSAQTVVTRVEHNSFPQKQRCNIIRWKKSVKGGLGIDSVAQAMKTKDTKNASLRNSAILPSDGTIALKVGYEQAQLCKP